MHQDWGPLIVDTGRYDGKTKNIYPTCVRAYANVLQAKSIYFGKFTV